MGSLEPQSGRRWFCSQGIVFLKIETRVFCNLAYTLSFSLGSTTTSRGQRGPIPGALSFQMRSVPGRAGTR